MGYTLQSPVDATPFLKQGLELLEQSSYPKRYSFFAARWRGSHVEMLKFGIECLNTERFDTRVPSKFLVSLFQIGDELDDWRKPYQWPGIYELIQKYFDGLLNEPKNKDYEVANKSFYVVVAWAAGQYQDAHRMMRELGTKFDRRAYSYLKVSEEQVLNDINSGVGGADQAN